MVVITIIGILGSFAVVKAYNALIVSNEAKIKHDLQTIMKAATMIRVSTGSIPERMEDLVNPKDADGREIVGLEDEPLDPWGHHYVYEVTDGHPVAKCLGKNNQEGGEGEDKDWEWAPGGTPK